MKPYSGRPFKWKLLSSTFMWYCFKPVNKTLVCDYSNESYWVVLSCGTGLSLWIKPWCVTIQMKAIEQYFHVVLFTMLYKVVLAFKSVDESLVCNHLKESYWAVLLSGAVYYLVRKCFSLWLKPKCLTIHDQKKAIEHCFHVQLF